MSIGFIPELNVPKTPPTKFDLQCSERLVRTIRRKVRLERPYSLRKWSKDFAKMRTVDKLDPVRIIEVFDWYLEHFGEKYVPEAFSAEGFRKKFLQIEKCMERYLEEEKKQSKLQVVVKKEVGEKLASFRDHIGWPKGTKTQLPAFCQLTHDNYSEFWDRMKELPEKIHDQNWPISYRTAVTKFVRWWNESPNFEKPGPRAFTLSWTNHVHYMVCRWQKWKGNLLGMAFDYSNALLMEEYKKEYVPYPAMTDHLWKRFMEVLNG